MCKLSLCFIVVCIVLFNFVQNASQIKQSAAGDVSTTVAAPIAEDNSTAENNSTAADNSTTEESNTTTTQIQQAPKDPGLIQEINPNFDAVPGLFCYQCHSVSTELQPLCDKSMFRLATSQEKYNMSLQCPHYQGAFCFTKVTKRGKQTETIRGCTGPNDKNGNPMKPGCMFVENIMICLCDTKFCNKATSVYSSLVSILCVMSILFHFN